MKLIPLETAHTILATFGITKPTRNYDRCVKEDGFDLEVFADVLFESPFIFGVDWRAWLKDELESITETLEQMDVKLESDLDEEGLVGRIWCGEREAMVKYCPSDEDDFDDVIRAIQTVVPDGIEFRRSPFDEGTDGWIYGVLSKDEWAELETLAKEVIDYHFESFPME